MTHPHPLGLPAWPPAQLADDEVADPWQVERSVTTPAALSTFVDARILSAADVHVARTLAARLDDPADDLVLLGAALAVRAPRRQHVCVDLDRVVELLGDPEAASTSLPGPLPWPDPRAWREALANSPLVHTATDTARPVGEPVGELAPTGDAGTRPLVLAGMRLYLDRHWRDERLVASALEARAARTRTDLDDTALAAHLDALFDAPAPDHQRLAAATAVLRGLTVVAGGPGTGKTTTVARLLALLDDQASASGRQRPSWALAAPTGKAAARLTESLRAAAEELAERRGVDDPTVQRLRAAQARTLHATLGVRADNRTRFHHDRRRPLPADVVVVDETSMVSLALIARLLEAVRHDARVILLGDPEQLASVEAGSVLGDVVAAAVRPPTAEVPEAASSATPVDGPGPDPALTSDLRSDLGPDLGHEGELLRQRAVGARHLPTPVAPGIARAVVVLERVHRFGEDSGIAAIAAAIRAGAVDDVLGILREADDLTWIEPEDDQPNGYPTDPTTGPDPASWDGVRRTVLAAMRPVVEAARAGDATTALAGLDEVRVLCATRQGPRSVADVNARVDRWLATATGTPLRGRFPAGRPVLVTANDRRLDLANGDVGIAVDLAGRGTVVAFPDPAGGPPRLVAPGRLPANEPVHAMTIHKSQGSQFTHVVVALPQPGSPLASRELFYTAVTRGRRAATVIGSAAAVRAAVARRAVRASGLAVALR